MSFFLTVRKKRTINLILNDHSIRFVELKQADPPISQKWGEKMLPSGIISQGKITDPETLENILEQFLDDWKIQKRKVRFTIPDSLVIIRKVTIPADIEEDEVRSYLYLELGSSIHLPFEDPVFDYFLVYEDDLKKEILLFAAPQEAVMQYAELLSRLTLVPIAADISPLAIYRLYDRLDYSSANESLFSVQFDLSHATMSVFDDAVPQFLRYFPIDFTHEKWEKTITEDGTSQMKYSGEMKELQFQLDDLFKEMDKLVDFYRYSIHKGSREVNKILLSGDHPLLEFIFDKMKERFGIPILMLNNSRLIQSKNNSLPTTFLLALGLALKEVE